MKYSKILSLALTLAMVAAAQNQPNFTGVWEMLPEKSEAGRKPERARIRIEHRGDELSITMRVVQNGRQQQHTFRYKIGAADNVNELHGAPIRGRAEWEGRVLVVRSTAEIAGKTLRVTDRWSLTADGNQLTFQEHHQYGSDPEGVDTMVLARRAPESREPDAKPQNAEEAYKNIQVMRGMPAERLMAVMQNFTRWLGVDCTHCHVPNAWEKEDKTPKETARRMLKMVRAINSENFPGANPVTCWTCHLGQPKPQSLPPQ